MHKHINSKKHLEIFFVMLIVLFSGFTLSVAAEEAPDVLVKRISQEVLDAAKTDEAIQSGDRKKVTELVEAKIFPYVDFERTTAMAAARNWQQASPEQKKKLSNEFRRLLVSTYAGALTNIRDQKIKYKPFRASPSDTEVQVRSEVVQSNKEPIELDYRLEKTSAGWKIYDMNIFGAWLIESYKPTFANEISKSGIDGLIKVLADKNNKLERTPVKGKKAD